MLLFHKIDKYSQKKFKSTTEFLLFNKNCNLFIEAAAYKETRLDATFTHTLHRSDGNAGGCRVTVVVACMSVYPQATTHTLQRHIRDNEISEPKL